MLALEIEVFDADRGVTYPKGIGCVSARQGAAWVDALNSGSEIEITFVDPSSADTVLMQVPNRITGGFASFFTSWGPTWELDVYPNIGAPGGSILSTFLVAKGGYAVYSGTSMATPFVAAVYALIAQIRELQSNAVELANLVSSTAKAVSWNDATGAIHELAPVAQQGPGLVQAYDAAYSTTLLDVRSLAFNDSDHFQSSMTFTIENTGSDTITYKISHTPATSMYALNNVPGDGSPSYFPGTISSATARMRFSRDTVNLQPKHRATITVTAVPPTDDNGMFAEALLPIYSGYIVINGSDGGLLSIPYLGLAGSLYSAANVDTQDSTILGCSLEDYTSNCNADDLAFTVPYPTTGVDPKSPTGYYYNYPTASVTLNLATALVRADVIPLSRNHTLPTTNVLGHESAGSVYGYPLAYQTRGSYTEVIFTGMLADGSVVPEGEYALAVNILRLFGDPDKEEDYTSLELIGFSLKYSNSSIASTFRREVR